MLSRDEIRKFDRSGEAASQEEADRQMDEAEAATPEEARGVFRRATVRIPGELNEGLEVYVWAWRVDFVKLRKAEGTWE